jgi:putative spermidine/putrescine transport system substrate-binding protein
MTNGVARNEFFREVSENDKPTGEETEMTDSIVSRRHLLGAVAGGAALGAFPAFAQKLALPGSPVNLTIIDVAGNLALTQKAIEAYRAANPKLVSHIAYGKAPAPELPGKIHAQQDAGRVDIDLVLTGTDALAAGIDQNLWLRLLPDYAASLPKLADIYQPAAAKMQALAQDQGVCVTYNPSGPLLEYAPERVKAAPTTPEELLAWTRANPKRFMYARPANSGPGRTLLMGLPYIFGDKDPKDPVGGWDKTWAYLQELGKNVEYYPTGTGETMKRLGDGSLDIIASTTGWDINPRVLGVVPKSAAIVAFKSMHWIADAHFMCIPRGVPTDRVAVLLDLMSYLLGKPAQAITYDDGYFYPGPAVKDVPVSMAPADSQAALAEYGRAEYADLDKVTVETPLAPDKMVIAFRMWDEKVGSAKAK